MGLDDLQDEARRHRGVKSVAAAFENRHAYSRRQPMGRAHGAEGSNDLGPGGEFRARRGADRKGQDPLPSSIIEIASCVETTPPKA
jgi:hypothetical protein